MTNILSFRSGCLETITLDRPEALNALNSEMVAAFSQKLEEISENAAVKTVLIKGAGDRAFCAGGDIKAARLGAMAAKEGRIKLSQVIEFFIHEYAMNQRLHRFEKPTISFMNGITMGGGVGIAGACRYRIATEKTRWAMPEVSIGFWPDVGAAYYLARAPYNVGKYLGLTGIALGNAADLIKCGFATHLIKADNESILLGELENVENIESVLDNYSEQVGETSLPYGLIEKCFSSDTVEQIIANLEEDGCAWALETSALIKTKSPTSLKVALRHITLAGFESFEEVIARDLKLASKFLAGHDLIEGVRAVVVDKDRSPKWSPGRLEDVETIEDYFN